jgi:hypothetical protein
MEYIAIRENQKLDGLDEQLRPSIRARASAPRSRA